MQVSARKATIATGCWIGRSTKRLRGREDDEADDHRLGRRGADIADDDLEVGDRRREDLVDRADELREVDAEGGVGDRLHQHGEHDEAGDDEGAVGDAVDLLDARADRGAEDHEVERGRDDRRDEALEKRAEGPRSSRTGRSPRCRASSCRFLSDEVDEDVLERLLPGLHVAQDEAGGARDRARRARRCRCAWPRGRRSRSRLRPSSERTRL